MHRILAAVVCWCVLALDVRAQSVTYVPSNTLPNGREVLLVYLGADSCGPCHAPAVKEAVARMKSLVATQARKSGASFTAIGVANDWDQRLAAAFVATAGPFDQVVLGGNFTNLAFEQFVWRQPDGPAGMPQIIVLERTVTLGDRIRISEPRVLRRLVGADEIPAWVAAGAPIAPASKP